MVIIALSKIILMRHVFDLDHTLLKGNVSFEFGKHLYKRGWISSFQLLTLLFFYFRHKYFNLPLEDLHQAIFKRLFFGKKISLIQHEVNLFLENLPDMLYQPAFQRLEPSSLILSSSPDFLVVPLAKKLGVEGHGSTYAVDVDGQLSHISAIMDGDAKARLLPSPCTYYTDSILDLPTLKSATHCVAVRPDKKLSKVAFLHGWEQLTK